MKGSLLSVFLVFILICLLSVTPAFGLTIDEFNGAGESKVIEANPAFASTNVLSTSAVGGSRLLYIGRYSTFNDGWTSIRTNGKLFHSQDSGVTALSRVTWDKDDNALDQVIPNGLGSIDLTQDGGDRFKFLINFDHANGKSSDLILKLYDSTDLSGSTVTTISIVLDQPLADFLLEIPFTALENDGAVSLVGPNSSVISATVLTTISGLTTIKRVGAIVLEIRGLNGDADLNIDSIKTNGTCDAVPDANGDVIDDCGVCKGNPLYKKSKDPLCPGSCLNDPLYKAIDDCGFCPQDPRYNSKDTVCGRCADTPNYNKPRDPCGVCDGDGSSCADCSGTPNGTSKLDLCNVCNGNNTTCLDCAGNPNGTSKLDACNICGGGVTDPLLCNVEKQCTTVQASAELLKFEERLVTQATTISKKFKEENARNKRNKCGINAKPSEKRVNTAVKTIKNAGNDIFTKGVEICGDGCVTVSYADQVKALIPTLKVIESETKSLAKKVQKCYQKKKIKTAQSINGLQTTINTVTTDLTQLIQDCKDKQVCPK
jgi:hypothetical protein